MRDAFGEIDAKLGKKPTDHVDELRALPNEEIARPVQRQRRLLLNRLDRHEAHGRTSDRLTDGLRIASGGISRTSCPRATSSRAQ